MQLSHFFSRPFHFPFFFLSLFSFFPIPNFNSLKLFEMRIINRVWRTSKTKFHPLIAHDERRKILSRSQHCNAINSNHQSYSKNLRRNKRLPYFNQINHHHERPKVVKSITSFVLHSASCYCSESGFPIDRSIGWLSAPFLWGWGYVKLFKLNTLKLEIKTLCGWDHELLDGRFFLHAILQRQRQP